MIRAGTPVDEHGMSQAYRQHLGESILDLRTAVQILGYSIQVQSISRLGQSFRME
jgi:hypothetical protein